MYRGIFLANFNDGVGLLFQGDIKSPLCAAPKANLILVVFSLSDIPGLEIAPGMLWVLMTNTTCSSGVWLGKHNEEVGLIQSQDSISAIKFHTCSLRSHNSMLTCSSSSSC
ncbi:hypothetical protein NC651_008528 [Populus alba x Populus x berolinensis]|nr:hypothetical protein NC651_008528 [Populus alba x Populus x berolinensis]